MELKIYLRMVAQKWWLVVIAFVVTFAITAYFTFSQIPIYETTATFLVAPNVSDVRTDVSVFSLLSTRSEIASTYAEVASSNTIKKLATDKLAIANELRPFLQIDSQLMAGTLVLRITGQGTHPEIVRDFTNQVGTETIDFTKKHYTSFALQPLDSARLPQRPIRPNVPLNLAVGAAAGLLLGVVLAFFAIYLQTPSE